TASLELRIGYGSRPNPHGAGPAGMVGSDRGLSNECADFRIALYLQSRGNFAPAKRIHGLLVGDRPGKFESFSQALEVIGNREEVVRDSRRRRGIAGTQQNFSAAVGMQKGGPDGISVLISGPQQR